MMSGNSSVGVRKNQVIVRKNLVIEKKPRYFDRKTWLFLEKPCYFIKNHVILRKTRLFPRKTWLLENRVVGLNVQLPMHSVVQKKHVISENHVIFQ